MKGLTLISTDLPPTTDGIINVGMDKETARKFELFCQHFAVFDTLLSSGVFTTKNGEAVIRFDHKGTLTQVNMHVNLYDRRHMDKPAKDWTVL